MTKQPHVLVPVDGSAAAKRAVGYGTLLADRLSARISFTHVRPPIGSSGEPKVGSDDEAEALLDTSRVRPSPSLKHWFGKPTITR